MDESQSFLMVSYGNISIYKMSRGLVDWMIVRAIFSSHLEKKSLKRMSRGLVDCMKVNAFFNSHLEIYPLIK